MGDSFCGVMVFFLCYSVVFFCCLFVVGFVWVLGFFLVVCVTLWVIGCFWGVLWCSPIVWDFCVSVGFVRALGMNGMLWC